MSDLLKKTETYMEEKGLLDLAAGFRVVIGVSGGADSVCLLLLLYELSRKYQGQITAVHINHNLRGAAADADQAFVEDLCAKLGIGLRVFSEDVEGRAKACGLTTEEAGRKIRYERFAEVALSVGAKVAVAHQMEDNAETVLFHLLRGADLKGLAGMQPETVIEGVCVIRPLLLAQRSEIVQWLKERGQTYCEDATNEQTDYSRNRIRHLILKEMKALNPKAAEHICSAAEAAGNAAAYIDHQIEEAYRQNAKEAPGSVTLSTDALKEADPVLASGLVYRAIARLAGSEKDFSRVHVEDVLAIAFGPTGKKAMLPQGLEAVNSYGQLIIQKQEEESLQKPEDETICILQKADGLQSASCLLSGGKRLSYEVVELADDCKKRNALIEKKKYTKAFDYDTITGSLFVGPRLPGDKIAVGTGTKSVGRYMIDEKIPAALREKILILRDEKETVWIIGYRIGQTFKITEKTRRALVITITECENADGSTSLDTE